MKIVPVVSLLLSSVLAHASSSGSNRRELTFPKSKPLSAAALSSRLKARAQSVFPVLKRKASFDYLADEIQDKTVFATTLDVESQQPVLALEDLDDVLDSVRCTESEIQLTFASLAAEEGLVEATQDSPEFIAVTSHDGCDLEGQRSAHRVTDVSVNLESHTVTLKKTRIDWHDAFSSTKVSFSRRHPSEIQRRGSSLAKRQGTSASSFSSAPDHADELNSSTDATFDISYPNRVLYPVELPGASDVLPDLPLRVTCKTCALRGEIQLSRGQFNIEEEDDDILVLDDVIDFFQEGAVELLVKEFSSQIELEFELASEGPLIEISMELPPIPLTPFQIAGVVAFGPQIVPEVIITADIEEDIGFSYGFNVAVPDHSRILINMTEFGDSEITGFDETTFTPLPFEASTEVTSMELGIAFQPKFLLGISTGVDALNINVDGGIGAFVTLPSLSLNVSHVTDVDENCDAAGESTEIYGNATLLVPSVEVDMGVIASFDVQITNLFNKSAETAPVLASASRTLPTACVNFEPEVQPTTTAGVLAAGDTRSGDGDEDSSDDNGNAGSVASRSTGLLSAMVLSVVAAGFCLWG
ncbi:hypothetical protein BJY04DRAFT_230599 [Aspergillus karnatakaensis]|uniref:putative GPI anchored protein n=1 Tax=Aspergillus karnatakaensis TaxID=1810916 RepID=UPI003CCDB92C